MSLGPAITARRIFLPLVALALLAGACSSTATTTTTTTTLPPAEEPEKKEPPKEEPTTSSTTTAAPSTTQPPTVKEQIDEAKGKMVEPEHVEGGTLSERGQFLASAAGVNDPLADVMVWFYVDENGRVNAYLEGPSEKLRSLWIEFDAVDGNGQVVSETSYVGSHGEGPNWVATTAKGTARHVADTPPPETPDGETLGVVIPTDINVSEERTEISIWLYCELENGEFEFSHYRLTKEQALANAADGASVAALFSGLLGLDPGAPDPLVWVPLDQ